MYVGIVHRVRKIILVEVLWSSRTQYDRYYLFIIMIKTKPEIFIFRYYYIDNGKKIPNICIFYIIVKNFQVCPVYICL